MKTRVLSILSLSTLLAASAWPQVTSIVDVQRNPDGGASLLVGQAITVEGVVTASAKVTNLGAIFIQQLGEMEWAGLQLRNGSGIYSLDVGDLVRATGTVREISGTTVLDSITETVVIGFGVVDPVVLEPSVLSDGNLADNEKYESMLVELVPPPGEILQVVSQNADGNSNFGEWRVGTDPGKPDSGARLLTGRQTSNLISSLNVSYINDDVWETNSGRMQVPGIVVVVGDAFPVIRGILGYGSGTLKLLPRTNADFWPRDAAIEITDFRVDKTATHMELTWSSFEGASYRIFGTENFSVWSIVEDNIASQGEQTTLEAIEIPSGYRFFRVFLQ